MTLRTIWEWLNAEEYLTLGFGSLSMSIDVGRLGVWTWYLGCLCLGGACWLLATSRKFRI